MSRFVHATRPTLRRPRGEAGFVLVSSLLALTVIVLFLLASLAYVLQNAPLSRRDQDSKIALAAAQTGLEDYVAHLNVDAGYWLKGNNDASNPALGSAGSKAIPGAAGPGATFRYQVLSSLDDVARTGTVRVLVTGTSTAGTGHLSVSHALTATVRPRTFLDFAYLSDIEVIDPQLIGSDPGCARYAYGSDSRQGLSCPAIIWKSGDKVNGPLHSNDALTIDSPVNFGDPRTESSWPDIKGAGPSAKTWLGASATVAGNPPVYADPLPLPNGNDELIKYVAPDADGDGQVGPGCYYTGATRIVFHGTTMTVYSPSTSNPATPDRCLTVSDRSTPQDKTIPPVIYVDSTADTCTQGALGYPAAGESVTAGGQDDGSWGRTTNYDCHRGSAYVSGQVDSQVTVTTRDDILITGDLTLADRATGDNVTGLIAGNYVWVYHPVTATGDNLLRPTPVTQIQAAMLSLRHSFVVQNWDSGSLLGPLSVLGTIGQKMRGPVGATDPTTGKQSGYLKDYQYDDRFKSIQPPYFLKPSANLWQVLSVTDK